MYTSLNKKDFSEASVCRHQPSVSTTKYRPGSPRSAILMHVNIVIPMVICKFVHYIISSKYHGFRAGANGPAAPVLAGSVFLKVKNRSPFLQKAGSREER